MHVDTLAMNALSLPSLLPFKFSVNDSIGRVELLSSFPSCGSPSKTRTKCPCCNHVTSAIDCPRVYKYNLLKRLFVVEAFRMCGTLAGVGRFLVRLGIPSFAACRLCVANTFVRSRQGQLSCLSSHSASMCYLVLRFPGLRLLFRHGRRRSSGLDRSPRPLREPRHRRLHHRPQDR